MKNEILPIQCNKCGRYFNAKNGSLVGKFDVNEVRGMKENTGIISDGYHTFDELYEHRIVLYVALCSAINSWHIDNGLKQIVWRSKKHSDGELAFGGTWFLLGIFKEKGAQITYHLPIGWWEETDFAETLEQAPEFDGHTPQDVLERIKKIF